MRILLVTPNFFDYPQILCEGLRALGHEVDWFDDRPSTNSLIKSIIRIKKDLINIWIAKYFEKIVKKVKKYKYDKFILVSGQSLSFTENMIAELRALLPTTEFILYQWDSLANFSYIKRVYKYFDRCYSFDPCDVAENTRLEFLPLFYCERYEKIGELAKDKYKYDIMFVGTAHPKKYKYVKEMAEKLKPAFKKQFIYFFFPSRLVYVYRKIKNSEFKNAKYSEFHFESISGEMLDQLMQDSKCVLDSAQTGQNGLTIRVIEALGAKRKIITTNKNVVKYDFYREENIYVYDGKFDYNSVFFTEPYIEIEKNIYEKYSLKNWLNILLNK